MQPLTNATAAVVATTASRLTPPLSRSSTAPIITTSHSSSSQILSSGQRSQRASPEHADDIRAISRADDRPPSRLSTSTSSEQKRYPQIPTVATEDQPGTEHRPSPRAGPIYMEVPRPISRAYSTTTEERPRPPSAYRAMSSSQILPSPATEQSRPSPVYRSPSSMYSTPTNGSSSWVFPNMEPRPVQGPPAIVLNREPAPTNLPQCPRASPVAGYHDWYTVTRVSDIKICPTCMTTLGPSRFREIFVPVSPPPMRRFVAQ